MKLDLLQIRRFWRNPHKSYTTLPRTLMFTPGHRTKRDPGDKVTSIRVSAMLIIQARLHTGFSKPAEDQTTDKTCIQETITKRPPTTF